MPSPTDPSNPPTNNVDLDVHGTIPTGLSGRLVGIGRDSIAHSLQMHGGRASYRCGHFGTNAVVHQLIAFGESILAFGDGSLSYELSAELHALRRVDLAGQGRALAAHPTHDPVTGELHLIARAADGVHAHVVVSAGALTRRSRSIGDIPSSIKGLALTRGHLVFVTDGFIGVAPRDGEARTTWIATGVAAPYPVHAHDAGDAVELLVLTPSLERWMLHPAAGSVERKVLDGAPRSVAHVNTANVAAAPRWVWSAGGETMSRHDLVAACHTHRGLRSRVLSDFVVVPDPTRLDDTAAGLLHAFIHDPFGTTTDLCVIDASDITAPAMATIRIPRPISRGFRCTWIPATHQ
jgi:carotenoid cleavage dioxygenase